MFRADLHCHTTFSDGTLSPKEVVAEALACGLQGLAFTDHDDVGAYEANMGIELVSGVELSCMEKDESVHILGYGFDVEAMREVCLGYKELRDKRNILIAEKLADLGMPIELEELRRSGSLGRPQIAEELIRKGYVDSFREAFDKWIGDDRPAFVRVKRYSVSEGIDQIHACGGFAVLAHPHLIQKRSLLKQVVSYPFDGIEAHYAKMPPYRCKRFEQIAKERGWLMTGGSDFHGAIKPQAILGSSWSREDVFRQLQGGRR